MAINFLTDNQQKKERLRKIKRLVTGISTVVLVLNVVGVAGFSGWWWYVHQQEKTTSTEVVSALRELTGFATVETLVRQVEARSKLLEQALAVNKAGQAASDLMCAGVTVTSWQYGSEGQTVSISGPEVTVLEECGKTWKQKYPDVTMTSAEQAAGIGWTTNWQLSGGVK